MIVRKITDAVIFRRESHKNTKTITKTHKTGVSVVKEGVPRLNPTDICVPKSRS